MSAARSQAPAFQLEVRAPFFWRAAHGLAWSLAWLAGAAAVLAQVGTPLGPPGLPGGSFGIGDAASPFLQLWQLLLLLPAPLLGFWACRASGGAGAQLLWDGRSFAWRAGAAVDAAAGDAERRAVQVQVVLDMGGFLLLRCCGVSSDAGPPALDGRDSDAVARCGAGDAVARRGAARWHAGLARLARASGLPSASRPVFVPLLQSQHPGVWLRLRWALFSARRLPPGRA